MKKYIIYFHDRLEEWNDIEDDVPTGHIILSTEEYERLLNPNMKIRFLESDKLHGHKSHKNDVSRELHFECWLAFEAKDDDDAKSKAQKVLEENDYEWVSVYILLEGVPYEEGYMRRVQEVGIPPLDEEVKELSEKAVKNILEGRVN